MEIRGFEPATEINPITIRSGKAITVKADTIIWLPRGVPIAKLLMLSRSGERPKFGPEPDLTN